MRVDFKIKQREFAAHIRDPEHNPAPADVTKPRMAMYRELFFNNIESFLADNFPVLKKILGEQAWHALAQDFFAKHQCTTPYFCEIADEFLDYLQNERNEPGDFPFLLELAHYEWVEMALAIAKDEPETVDKNSENLRDKTIRLSPLVWPLVYRYPVHRLAPDFLPETAPEQPTCLIVYRDVLYNVNFIEITPLTYRLLQLIQEQDSLAVETCLRQIATELPQTDPETMIAGGLQILAELAEKSIIQVIS